MAETQNHFEVEEEVELFSESISYALEDYTQSEFSKKSQICKMAKVDMELKKAFTELQEKQLETTQKLQLADIQIETLKRTKQHATITEREINSLEEGTRTYESVGRMFSLTPIEKVKENLRAKQNTAEEKIKVLENNKTYLENSLKEATNSLRELVQTKKDS